MAHIVVYCTCKEDAETVRNQFAPILEEWEEQPFYREFIGDRAGFLSYIRGNPYLLLFVVQSGPEGKETVRLAKRTNAKASLVWFAEEDYALDAFSFHIAHFGRLPVDRKKLLVALDGCSMTESGLYSLTVVV